MQIENKVFIVTGGASGLGAATAEMLVQAGAIEMGKICRFGLGCDRAAGARRRRRRRRARIGGTCQRSRPA